MLLLYLLSVLFKRHENNFDHKHKSITCNNENNENKLMIWQGSENINIENIFQIFHTEMKKIGIKATKWLSKVIGRKEKSIKTFGINITCFYWDIKVSFKRTFHKCSV